MDNICQHRTEHEIRKALKDLPQGLDAIFIRSLQKIHRLHPLSRDRVRRALRWIVCASGLIKLSELVDSVAIDEMDTKWDDARVVSDPHSLVDDCAGLVTVIGEFVHITHATVRDFLTSEPKLYSDTLPQYHIYPTHETYYILAKDCMRFFTAFQHRPTSIFGSWWLFLAWNSGPLKSRLYRELFRTRIERRGKDQAITFPHATHVRVVDCKIFDGETYSDVFLRPGSAGSCFRRHHLPTMFPACRYLEVICAEYRISESHQSNTYDSLVSAKNIKVPRDLRRATHVQVTGIDFVLTDGPVFEFYPSDSVMITYSGNGRNLTTSNSWLTIADHNDITGTFNFITDQQLTYHPSFSVPHPPIEGISR